MAKRKRSAKSKSWQDTNAEILDRLDLLEEFAALGVDITGRDPSEKGWVACRAVDREDRTPSAAVNVVSGRYKDLGGDGTSLSLWDLAVHVGRYQAWQDARSAYAQRAGVDLNGQVAGDPAQHLVFRPWNDMLVALWCRHKAGVTPEAVRAAGGRLARYRNQYTVVALPCYGVAGPDADPVGWVLWNSTGGELPVFRGRGEPPAWEKMKTTYGSEAGLLGQHGLEHLGGAEIVWLVEGPADLLALWSAIPADERQRHVVLSNAGGANQDPRDWMMRALAGKRIRIVRDADRAGEAGGEKWAPRLAPHVAEVRWPRLPYDVADKHGKDLRDWLQEGHTFVELAALADEAEPITTPPSGPSGATGGTLEPIAAEHDDDPHRLSRVFLRAYQSDDGHTLRYWREEWWHWTGQAYQRIPGEELRARFTRSVKQEFDRLYQEAVANSTGDTADLKARKVTRALIGNCAGALEGAVVCGGVGEMRNWIENQ